MEEKCRIVDVTKVKIDKDRHQCRGHSKILLLSNMEKR